MDIMVINTKLMPSFVSSLLTQYGGAAAVMNTMMGRKMFHFCYIRETNFIVWRDLVCGIVPDLFYISLRWVQ